MTTYYPLYVLPTYNLPVVYPDWTANAITTIYSPVTCIAPPIYTALCPYTGTILADPVAPVACVADATCMPDINCIPDVACTPDVTFIPDVNNITTPIFNVISHGVEEIQLNTEVITEDPVNYKYQTKDPIELFISLPNELFPPARRQFIDPNPVIDQFCQLLNINGCVNWILDIEFGLPRVPVTRSVAVYNVKSNNVFCKNSLRVHPGFETCTGTFKEVILNYYKSLMYLWYKGYVIMNHDKSFENFQSWLVIPMNLFGMGWR